MTGMGWQRYLPLTERCTGKPCPNTGAHGLGVPPAIGNVALGPSFLITLLPGRGISGLERQRGRTRSFCPSAGTDGRGSVWEALARSQVGLQCHAVQEWF